MPLTDEEKEGLSPEEVAAIDGGDDDDTIEETDAEAAEREAKEAADAEKQAAEDKAAAQKIADEKAATEKAEADKAATDDKAAEAKAKEDADAKALAEKEAADAAAAKEADEVPAPQQTQPPQLPSVDPEKLEAAKTKFDEAKTQFDDGEIDYQAFDEIKTEYNRLRWKDEDAKEYNQNARHFQWQGSQDKFFEDNPRFLSNQTLNAAYVATVNRILKTEDGATMTDDQLLAAAKKQVESDLVLTADPTATEAEEVKRQAAEKARKAKAIAAAKSGNADRSTIEDGDIAKLPSAEEESDPSEFDYLDRLDGEKFQEAIEKLTPAQLERYESAA
ncbi:MAG: hypothetical protein HGJ94_18340 [Desulfosarcina sp.]|nr:hypothetical protein [Desulfosarcina sp.]